MFKTDSGKLAPLKQSSIMRAMAVIGEGNLLEKGSYSTCCLSFTFWPLFLRVVSLVHVECIYASCSLRIR